MMSLRRGVYAGKNDSVHVLCDSMDRGGKRCWNQKGFRPCSGRRSFAALKPLRRFLISTADAAVRADPGKVSLPQITQYSLLTISIASIELVWWWDQQTAAR